MASTSAISPARGWRTGPGGTSKRAEGGAGPAGGQAGERRGAGTPLGAGAAAELAPALLSAGSGFFRERLPWVTRLRGDTALPSPSGNLSIREIDNPQRRAVHPLGSPGTGARRPKVAPLAWEGGDVGASPPRRPGRLQLVEEEDVSKERVRGAAWERLFPSLRPAWACSKTNCHALGSRRRRGAPWWPGQNFVESRRWFYIFCQPRAAGVLLQCFGGAVFLS